MTPKSNDAQALLEEGIASLRAGRLEEASRAFLETQRRRPGDPASLSYLGEIALRRGSLARALELYSAAALRDGAPRSLAQVGQLKRRLGRTEEGLLDLERAIRLDRSCLWMASLGYGSGADPAGRAKDLARLDSLLSARPSWAFGFLSRGIARVLQAGRGSPAADGDFRRAARLEPFWASASRAWQAEALRWGGRHRRAMKILDQVVKADPRDVDAILRRGESRLFVGPVRSAFADFDRAVELKPESGSALAWRAEARLWVGDAAGALRDCDAAEGAREPALWAKVWRGAALLLLGRRERAEAELSSAVGIDPLDAEAWTWRGEVRRLARREEEALDDLDRALSLRTLLGAHLNRALANQRLGREKEARDDAARAVELGPRLFRRVGGGQLDSATLPAALERALELSRGNRTAHPTFVEGRGGSVRLRPA